MLEPWPSIVGSKEAGIEVNGYIGNCTNVPIGEMHPWIGQQKKHVPISKYVLMHLIYYSDNFEWLCIPSECYAPTYFYM